MSFELGTSIIYGIWRENRECDVGEGNIKDVQFLIFSKYTCWIFNCWWKQNIFLLFCYFYEEPTQLINGWNRVGQMLF